MNGVRYLTLPELLQLYQAVMGASGGSAGIADPGLIASSLAQPRATFGEQELYPDLPAKAAALGYSLITNHGFTDGNKRVGHAAVEAFLLLNGWEIECGIDEQERAILEVASGASSRQEWKDRAIADISTRVGDLAWVSNELVQLKARGTNDAGGSDRWLSRHLIAMRNGDRLSYANICQKENHRIQDIFLGRGSDGQWYYSTYHFCIGMVVLRMEEQSEDPAAFAKTYYLRSFDGHSDQCLQQTWPPDSR